jgi:hypothetical protein
MAKRRGRKTKTRPKRVRRRRTKNGFDSEDQRKAVMALLNQSPGATHRRHKRVFRRVGAGIKRRIRGVSNAIGENFDQMLALAILGAAAAGGSVAARSAMNTAMGKEKVPHIELVRRRKSGQIKRRHRIL